MLPVACAAVSVPPLPSLLNATGLRNAFYSNVSLRLPSALTRSTVEFNCE